MADTPYPADKLNRAFFIFYRTSKYPAQISRILNMKPEYI